MGPSIRNVIVVGGGLAGLAAAATAAAGGAPTLLLEAHQPGGRARTTLRQGFRCNFGPHALYVGGPGMSVLKALGVHPHGSPPPLKRYRLLMNGRQHVMPAGPASLLRTTALGTRSKVKFGRLLGRLSSLDAAELAGMTANSWLSGLGLPPDAISIARALVRLSTYVGDLDELGADAALRQLQLATKAGVLYLDGGWQMLVDALAARVRVQTHATVTAVDWSGDHVELSFVDGDAGSSVLHAGAVVLATGGPDAAATVLGETATRRWGDLGGEVDGACLDVASRRVPQPGWVLGVDAPLYGTTQGPPARLAPDGQAVISLIRYGARDAKRDRADLQALRREVGVSDGDVVFERFLARMTVAGGMPRAANGGLRGRPGVDSTGLRSVYLAGDWVGPDGLLADAALASGHHAGKLALQAVRGPRPVAA